MPVIAAWGAPQVLQASCDCATRPSLFPTSALGTRPQVILYSFPAVCWIYGAGVIFSLFVSLVFWGAPVYAAYQSLKAAVCVVSVRTALVLAWDSVAGA